MKYVIAHLTKTGKDNKGIYRLRCLLLLPLSAFISKTLACPQLINDEHINREISQFFLMYNPGNFLKPSLLFA